MPDPVTSLAPAGTEMAAAQSAGTVVAAPVAPASGPIPAGVSAVVVPVKPWYQSSEIVISLLAVLGTVIDSVFSAVIPLLGDGPIDKERIKAALIRSVVAGLYAAFVAWRRKSSNSVVA